MIEDIEFEAQSTIEIEDNNHNLYSMTRQIVTIFLWVSEILQLASFHIPLYIY